VTTDQVVVVLCLISRRAGFYFYPCNKMQLLSAFIIHRNFVLDHDKDTFNFEINDRGVRFFWRISYFDPIPEKKSSFEPTPAQYKLKNNSPNIMIY